VDAQFDLSEGALAQVLGNDVVSNGSAFLKRRLRLLHWE
jgi:hypothetical protein